MKLGIIGAGNMAGALAKGVATAGVLAAGDIIVSDIDSARRSEYETLGIVFTTDNQNVFATSDVLILAVKPGVYPTVLKEAAKIDGIENKLIITIAAGITIASVKSYFHKPAKVMRTMPNTPAIVGAGMTVISYEQPVSADDIAAANLIFGSVGKVCELPESLMDGVPSLCGSSPAYVYMFIEALADGAVRDGIPRSVAYHAAAQAVLGAAKMVLETGKHPGELKDMVCTPGGTTIEAINVLEQTGFRGSIMAAMEACTNKAKELG